MKAALYARVSTGEQETENQLVALREYAIRRGWEVVLEYVEEESAWKAGHQRELARALQDARRRYDILLVWALDRLSREGALAILSLVHRLGRYGVRIISLQEEWTEAPGELQELLLAVVGWVARMESQRRSERVKAAMDRARREGKHMGRPAGSRDRKKRRVRRDG